MLVSYFERRAISFLILFSLVFGITGWLTLSTSPGPFQDDAFYQRVAYDYVTTGKAVNSFHPESAVLLPVHSGRLFLFVSGNVSTLLGISLRNVRIISLLSLVASIPVLFLLIRRLGLKRSQSLLLTIVISSSVNFVLLREARPEALGMLFILMVFTMLVSEQQKKAIVVAGILCALLIEIHAPYLIFAVAFCLVPLFSRNGFRDSLTMFLFLGFACAGWLLVRYTEHGSFQFLINLADQKALLDKNDLLDAEKLFGISSRFLAFPIKIYQEVQYGKRNIIDILFLVTGVLCSIATVVLRRERCLPWQRLNLFIVCAFALFLLVGRFHSGYLRMLLPLCYLSMFRTFVLLTRDRAVLVNGFILFFAVANIAITAKVLWTGRAGMDSLPQIRQAIENHIPKGAKVLAKESLWFASPSMNLVGVRDLENRSPKDDIGNYFHRQAIQYVIDCNDLDIIADSGSTRRFVSENGRIIFYRAFPAQISNDMLRGQLSHTWGVSDTAKFLSIIAIEEHNN